MTRRDLLKAIFGAAAAAVVPPIAKPAHRIIDIVPPSHKVDFYQQSFSALFSTKDLLAQRTLSLDLPPDFNIFQIGIRLMDECPFSAAQDFILNTWVTLALGQQSPFLKMPTEMFGCHASALVPAASNLARHDNIPVRGENLQVILDSETIWTPPPGIEGQIIVQGLRRS